MCGIAGFYFLDGRPADPDRLKALADSMRERGPDDEGIFTDGSLGFTHRRLSIIDLKGGHQPMSYKNDAYVIVYNGEIFNYRELRGLLQGRGHEFATDSDTEVLLHLYEAYHEDMLGMLNGFFAFAIYDRAKQTLFLARDRFGIKPLYYTVCGRGIAFASKLRSLRLMREFDVNDVSTDSLIQYLIFQYIPGDATIHSHVFRLQPGHFLRYELRSGQFEQHPFWKLNYNLKRDIPFNTAKLSLRNLVTDSVRRRLVADVPLGVFLSGGMDSAIIAGIAAQESNRPLDCFTIQFPDADYDESREATQTAEHLRTFAKHGLNHHVRMVDPCDFSVLEILVREHGEPYADASMLPTYLLCKFAREHVTVTLSGDGADELFGGYVRYQAMGYLKKMRRSFSRPVWGTMATLVPDTGERTRFGQMKRLLHAAASPIASQYYSIISHAANELIGTLVGSGLANAASRKKFPAIPQTNDFIEMFMLHDAMNYLPGDILTKVDVCSMAASLEVRPPFLDYRVAEYAASLPLHYKLHNKDRKRILHEAFPEFLPPGLLERPKKGFGVPMAKWFRSEWNEKLKEHVLDGPLFSHDWFNRNAIEQLIAEHTSRKADRSYILFTLLMLALYLESEKD